MLTDDFLIADKNYENGQIILELGSVLTSSDDNRRIQVSNTEYILPPKMLYHACNPNAYINWHDMTLRAFNKIANHEKVTYHYGTSEYDYSIGAFECDCGSENCIKYFSGFKNMTIEQQQSISENISDYIRSKWKT